MTSLDYSTLLDKIRSRIGSWTARQLSFAGRLQLLSSVIASLTNFWISAFRLPNGCIDEIERMCSAFLWSGPDLNPRKAKIAWHDVCKPKEEGGLGLKSIREANEVCILKLIWRLLSAKSSFWVMWVHQNLIKETPFWSLRDPTSQTPGSWMWKKILKLRRVARDFVKMEVGRGNSISFWQDNWSRLGNLRNLVGERGYLDMGLNANATVEQAILINRRRRHRNQTLNRIEAELVELTVGYDAERTDVVLWRDNSGSFKPSFNTKQTSLQLRSASQQVQWHKGVWFTHNSPKYAFTTWVALHNRLPTGDRMCLWRANISATCVLCGHPYETRAHLFFECPFATTVGKNLADGILLREFTVVWSELIPLLTRSRFQCQKLYIFRYLFQATVYALWRERNNRRHGAPRRTTDTLIVIIDKEVRNRLSSISITEDRRFEGSIQFWFSSRPMI